MEDVEAINKYNVLLLVFIILILTVGKHIVNANSAYLTVFSDFQNSFFSICI